MSRLALVRALPLRTYSARSGNSHADISARFRWSRRARSSQALALRSKIVLSCAEGLDNKSVVAKLGCGEATVGKWCWRFVAKRLDGLVDEPRPGGPRSITDEQIERTRFV